MKDKQHLISLNKTVAFICEKFNEFELERTEKEKIINEL